MARTPPIRLTKNDRREYARLVKNAKAKARNVIKNYGIDLTDITKVPNIDSIKTRKEFNELTQKLSSFTNRANTRYQFVKNEQGAVANKFDINQAKRLRDIVDFKNEQRRKKLAKKPFRVKGEKTIMSVADRFAMLKRPPSLGIAKIPKFEFGKFAKTGDFQSYLKAMKEKADDRNIKKSMERMKQNFIETLEHTFNDDVDHIIELLERMPADDFYELYFQEEEFQFEHYYKADGLSSGEEGDLRGLENILTKYWKGELDFDFKSFGNRV